MSISCTIASRTTRSCACSINEGLREHRVVREEERGVLRSDDEVVQVGLVAVAGVHGRDLAVVTGRTARTRRRRSRRSTPRPGTTTAPVRRSSAARKGRAKCRRVRDRTTRGCRRRRRSSVRTALWSPGRGTGSASGRCRRSTAGLVFDAIVTLGGGRRSGRDAKCETCDAGVVVEVVAGVWLAREAGAADARS